MPVISSTFGGMARGREALEKWLEENIQVPARQVINLSAFYREEIK